MQIESRVDDAQASQHSIFVRWIVPYLAGFVFVPLVLIAEYNITALDRFFNTSPFLFKSVLFVAIFFIPSYLLLACIKGSARERGVRLLIFSASLIVYLPILLIYGTFVSCWALNHCL